MSWMVFIVTHGPIIDKYYKKDKDFSNKNYTFFNVSDNEILNKNNYKIINKSDVSNFISLGKKYAEGEVIYNIYKNNLYKEYDNIGFLHWDYELVNSDSKKHNITSEIEKIVGNWASDGKEFVSFSSYDFISDFNQKIMMDEDYPDTLTGDGKNCYETIIKEYNEYFNKNISLKDLDGKEICLCSAFLCSKENFEKLMGFYSFIVEKGYLNKFDKDNKNRFPGGMLERYIGVFFSEFKIIDLPLIHWFKKSFSKAIKSFLYKNFLRFFSKKYEFKK